MSEFGSDIPKGLISAVKDVLGQHKDLYGDDLRSRYNTPQAPSPEPEAPAPVVPEAPAPEANNEE